MKIENWIKKFGYYDYDYKWVNPRKKRELDSCRELFLVNSGFYFNNPIDEIEIPDEIITFKNLSKLVISCNKLMKSNNLIELKSLNHLELYNLEIVPSEIFELKSLEILVLKNCVEWESLPLNKNLKELIIYSNNKDLIIPSKIDSFINLEHLEIDYQKLKQSIKFDMGKMNNLKVLRIGCKSYYEQTGKLLKIDYENFEEELNKLSSLEELELISMEIPSIYEIIKKNRNLNTLKLTDCGVKRIPEILEKMEFLTKIEIT